MPRRYSDYPDSFIYCNVFARVGSIISTVSVIFFLFILWEALVSHRPAISRNHLRTSLEIIHSFPPINHSYTSIPVVSSSSNLKKPFKNFIGDNTLVSSYKSQLYVYSCCNPNFLGFNILEDP